ncbi:hypothetical protein [Streptomyces sp. HNM0574]|uniref:hypothetical protein n=1 Tax=Streptomyces sp. HNM0574 TaxID=2714954 RepID=UPI00146C1591|nr:hypothetical protein [Streptomyces sp. HNM0574]NLU66894.1 hypothetical protein [Streptomyces sp. HNM0574]
MSRSGAQRGGFRRAPARVTAAVALLLAALTLLSSGAATAAPGAGPDESQTAYLAERLRENPVYVTDQAPRVTPRSSAPAFAEQAKRTGVPTYVMVLPSGVTAGQTDLLPAVHDRLGKDGLYLLLNDRGYQTEAAAFGVDVPYEEAGRAALYESPHDATSLEYLTRFVDILRLGPAGAEARAESAERKYGVDSGNEPERAYVTAWEREEQSRLTGLLLGGVPVLVVGLGWCVRRRGRRVLHPLLLVGVAGASALAIGFGASAAFDQKRGTGAPPPTAEDMRARTDRVVAGLRESPVYVDPESPRPFSGAQLRTLTAHAEKSRVPVRVVVVPSASDDPEGGSVEWFARGLHRQLAEDGGRDGAVYLLSDPRRPHVEIVNFGVRLDDSGLQKIDDAAFDDAQRESRKAEAEGGTGDASGLFARVDGVIDELGTLGSGPPGEPYLGLPPETPDEENYVPSLFSGDLTSAAWEGAAWAAALSGLVAAVSAGVRRSRAGTGEKRGPAAPSGPRAPGAGSLRRTARRELAELREEFDRQGEHLPDAARVRAWDCLDAASLLADRDADGAVDKDADQPTLIAAVALLRVARAALSTKPSDEAALPPYFCGVDPLHGPATGTRNVRRTRGKRRGQRRQVCAECAALADDPGTARTLGETRLLLVADPARAGRTVPYNAVPGPLTGKGGAFLGIDEVVNSVREAAGVH